MPEVACDHISQERVFHTVVQGSYECFTLWKSVFRSKNDWMQPPEPLLDEMHCHPTRLQWVRNLCLIFHNQSSKCRRCSLWPSFDNYPSEDVPLRNQKVRAISLFTPPRRNPPLPDPLPLGNTRGHLSPSSSAKEDNDSSDNSTFPTHFDDYGSAPLFREETPPVINAWTFNSSGFLALPNWACTWKDQGYRLTPDFNKVSPQEHPTDYLSRFFPTVDKNGSSSLDVSELNSELKDNKRRKPISMGAYAMLDEAGNAPKTKASYNTFVRGKTRADDFIKLDLEQDHVPLTREQIAISVDIDSIIWVTRGGEFSSKGAINLHLKHHFTDQPPFSANPHVHITLFKPPYDEAELNHPELRLKAQFPLSHIPHMNFGHFGEATQQFNLYVFFPRMVHKNNNNNRAITIMPHELQELWLSEAVFKALTASMDHYPGTSEYLPHSVEQLRWKAGGHSSRQPTFPVSPLAINSLLANIRSKVARNEDLLSRFGSFFFVLDARGIKTLTKQHKSDMNAFQILQTVVPSLDWDHMMDRKNGELYLDLGVSFHPVDTPEPMVGLWRLSSLRPSYALMGHSKQNYKEYSHNMMPDYGGMKAETLNSTKEHTHIVKRISYNLHFEAVRKPGERAYVSKLDDMIRCNKKYVDSCKCWIQLLEAAENHSYGVRDELRAGAHVVTQLLPVAIERVCLLFSSLTLITLTWTVMQAETFLESDPIIWIPAGTFFKFSSRRFIELHDLHCKLALTRPDNYGTLSALILHLMRAVMVTSSNVPSYVQSALNRLYQGGVMERFGFFFVDDLDPNDMDCIDINLGAKDGCDVIRDHKAALAARCSAKTKQAGGIQLMESHMTADYPWGETVSWEMLQRLCKQQPVEFLSKFNFHQPEIEAESVPLNDIENLFISFTRETWLGIHEAFLPAGVRPCPNNLEDSMQVWTCQEIMARLGGRCTFIPTTYGLEGAPKAKDLEVSFGALRSLFFPAPDQSLKANTIWEGYSEQNGYIWRYWEVLEMYDDEPDKVHALHQGLDQIFERVQCLPQSKSNSNIWHATQGSVCFIINPCYYRIRAISTTAKNSNLGPQRPQVTKAELRKRLNPYDSQAIAKKRKINSNRKRSMKQKSYRKIVSVKQKNYRKPPKKCHRIERPFSRRGSSQLGSNSSEMADTSLDITDSGKIGTDAHGSSDSSESESGTE